MATNEDILAAVKQLDPANEDHWTADGLPRMDAVEGLLGADTNRKAITNAAPDFNRGAAQSLVDAAQDEETAGPTEDVDQDPPKPAPSTEGSAEPEDDGSGDDGTQPAETAEETDETAGDDNELDPLGTGPAEEKAEFHDQIQDIEDELKAIAEGVAAALQRRDELEQKMIAVVAARDAAFPPKTPAEAIKEFQANERARREERANAHRLLTDALKGVNVKPQGNVALSGLDAQLAGRKRPTFGSEAPKTEDK